MSMKTSFLVDFEARRLEKVLSNKNLIPNELVRYIHCFNKALEIQDIYNIYLQVDVHDRATDTRTQFKPYEWYSVMELMRQPLYDCEVYYNFNFGRRAYTKNRVLL